MCFAESSLFRWILIYQYAEFDSNNFESKRKNFILRMFFWMWQGIWNVLSGGYLESKLGITMDGFVTVDIFV